MKLNAGSNGIDNAEVERFSKWLLQIGDGVVGDITKGEAGVQNPCDLIKNSNSALDEPKIFGYREILSNLTNVNYFKQRCILALTLEVVTHVNNFMMSMLPSE